MKLLLTLLTITVALTSQSCVTDPITGKTKLNLPALDIRFKGPLTGSDYKYDTSKKELTVEKLGAFENAPFSVEAQK